MQTMTEQFDSLKLEVAQTRGRIDKVEQSFEDLREFVTRDVRELDDKLNSMKSSLVAEIRADIRRDLMEELKQVCMAEIKASTKSLPFAPAAPSAVGFAAGAKVAFVPRCFFLKGWAVYGDASTELAKDQGEKIAQYCLSLLPASDMAYIDVSRPLCPYRRNRQACVHLRADAPDVVRDICLTLNDALKANKVVVGGRSVWAQPDADQATKAKRAAVAKALAALRDEVSKPGWRWEPDWPSGTVWGVCEGPPKREVELGVFFKSTGWKWHDAAVRQHLEVESAVLVAAASS
jgi:hypothetical protein